MATGVPFISITKLPPAERQRRTNVEAQDYKARTRRTGLEKLKAMFKGCYKLIEEQQTLAKQVVEHGNSLVCEYATLIEAHEAYPPYDAAGPHGHRPRRNGVNRRDAGHLQH
jgi:hypothetical protein